MDGLGLWRLHWPPAFLPSVGSTVTCVPLRLGLDQIFASFTVLLSTMLSDLSAMQGVLETWS